MDLLYLHLQKTHFHKLKICSSQIILKLNLVNFIWGQNYLGEFTSLRYRLWYIGGWELDTLQSVFFQFYLGWLLNLLVFTPPKQFFIMSSTLVDCKNKWYSRDRSGAGEPYRNLSTHTHPPSSTYTRARSLSRTHAHTLNYTDYLRIHDKIYQY